MIAAHAVYVEQRVYVQLYAGSTAHMSFHTPGFHVQDLQPRKIQEL